MLLLKSELPRTLLYDSIEESFVVESSLQIVSLRSGGVDILAECTTTHLVEGIVSLLVWLVVTLVDCLGKYEIDLCKSQYLTVHGTISRTCLR